MRTTELKECQTDNVASIKAIKQTRIIIIIIITIVITEHVFQRVYDSVLRELFHVPHHRHCLAHGVRVGKGAPVVQVTKVAESCSQPRQHATATATTSTAGTACF